MANGEINIDALMPPEMADKAEAIGIKKANLDFRTMFSLAILAGRIHRRRGDLRHYGVDGGRGAALRREPAVGRPGLLPGPDSRCGGRRRVVHRQQPDRHGLGRGQGKHRQVAAQLGHRLSRQLRRLAADRS